MQNYPNEIRNNTNKHFEKTLEIYKRSCINGKRQNLPTWMFILLLADEFNDYFANVYREGA